MASTFGRAGWAAVAAPTRTSAAVRETKSARRSPFFTPGTIYQRRVEPFPAERGLVGCRRIAVLAVAGAMGLVWAAAARSQADATLSSRELPLRGTAVARFDMLGLHWLGSGALRFRTRALDGRWS